MVDTATFTNTQTRYRLLYLTFAAALAAGGLWAALIGGPAMRASAQEQFDREITAENLGFCEKFGMRSGTSELVACTGELAIVRQRQADRDRAAEIGL
ncbi:hypothetical protein [uncultured Bradyrhizobium sp.]|uniref:hypothetical protein n=1 Tax=Bradyrhizobium sp. TaxID=376 RepID=UPI002639CC98|nr:hypothetical protein [uncultured Bradyrhizobium sp.]